MPATATATLPETVMLPDSYRWDLMRSVTRQSYFQFVRHFWDTIIAEEPVWNWHIEYLCRELQVVLERVFKNQAKLYDLIINVPPGSTKSTLCTVMLQPWMWTRMPSSSYIGASYSAQLSVDLSRKSRNIVKSDKYKKCFPEIQLQWDQDAKSHFVNTQRGERIAVGTGGVTGRHGHVIGIDDPVNPNEALSEVKLKAANTWIKETLFNRKKNAAVTPIILIMQRLHQDDPTASLLATGNPIRHICLPAEESDKVKPKELRRCYVDGLLDPVRLSRKILNGYESTLAEYGYAGQYAQWPVPLGGGMFKYERILCDVPPKDFQRVVRFWDKAGTQGGGAYTVGGKLALDKDKRFWILDIVRGRWNSGARNIIIKQIAEMDGREVEIGVEQEPGSGGKESAEYTVADLAGWTVHVDKPGGSDSSKALRAEPFSVQVNNRNVFMAPGEWNKPLLDELQFFPFSKYKDQVDALSGGFNVITKPRLYAGGF